MIRSTRTLAILALPFALALAGCGDALDTPAGPAGGASGNVTATPPPAATATPTATPAPTPSTAGTCTLPARPDCGNSGCCPAGGPEMFGGAINDAQAHLERTQPNIFNPNGSLRLDEIEYTNLLAKTLMQLNPGMCARGGGQNGESISKDEVGIKLTNDMSQNIDVIIGSSNTPYIGAKHTCRPASF